MKEPTQFWDLTKPKMARDFLKNLRVGPKHNARSITGVELEDGTWVNFSDATDEQIVRFAKQIAEMIGPRQPEAEGK